MLRKVAFLSFLLLSLPCFAQQGQSKLPPRLIAAEMPSYPPIAEAARITGWLEVRVTVEGGKVVGTEVVNAAIRDRENHSYVWKDGSSWGKGGSQWLIAPTLTYLKTWRFNTDVNTSFSMRFTYDIAGAETNEPTTPTIQVLPTLDVNITVRPIKPVVEY